MVSNYDSNLTYYSEKNVPQELSLILPPYIPVTSVEDKEKFSTLINQIYTNCIYTDCKKPKSVEKTNYKVSFMWASNLSQKDVFINTSQGQEKLNHLRITPYQKDKKCVLIKWEFEIENRNIESYINLPEDNGRVQEKIFLNGLEFERFFASDFAPLAPKEFWNEWEQQKELNHYETIIYPQIINTIQKICKLNPLISLDVIDLGGGSGNLAERILKENTLTDSLRKIVVIDSNLTLIKKAQKRAVNNERLMPRHISIEEMSKNLYSSPEYSQSAHVIILCGVVAHQVLSKKTGLEIIAKCHSILRENGIIIAASLSPSLLNSSEYEEMGYNVLNKSYTFKDSQNQVQTNDFYILQRRPGSSPSDSRKFVQLKSWNFNYPQTFFMMFFESVKNGLNYVGNRFQNQVRRLVFWNFNIFSTN